MVKPVIRFVVFDQLDIRVETTHMLDTLLPPELNEDQLKQLMQWLSKAALRKACEDLGETASAPSLHFPPTFLVGP